MILINSDDRDVYRMKFFFPIVEKGGAIYVRALCIVTVVFLWCYMQHHIIEVKLPSLATFISAAS
jgi:hypothetical protein